MIVNNDDTRLDKRMSMDMGQSKSEDDLRNGKRSESFFQSTFGLPSSDFCFPPSDKDYIDKEDEFYEKFYAAQNDSRYKS
jgi:hypothetical protein